MKSPKANKGPIACQKRFEDRLVLMPLTAPAIHKEKTANERESRRNGSEMYFCSILLIFLVEWLGGVLRVILYLLIPFVVYLGQKEMVAWMSEQVIDLYNLSFGVLVVFVIFTSVRTGRCASAPNTRGGSRASQRIRPSRVWSR